MIARGENDRLAALNKIAGDPGADVTDPDNCSCHVNLQGLVVKAYDRGGLHVNGVKGSYAEHDGVGERDLVAAAGRAPGGPGRGSARFV
ncbi:hypothetical protein GCM10023346_03270 [Arthrobacter gyeryongensis]|uniref:Uncharacterized protein n=1 Tax=Arthrobacter gyeryongensis TaxID=1650592 RepID=A0ABP9S0T4_9MICC